MTIHSLQNHELHARRWMRTLFSATIALCLIWSLIIAGSLAWNLAEQQRALLGNALIMTRTAFEKDVLYRSWNAGHGGVYVPITGATQPNPYLNDYPGQVIETVAGERYTLINPAYMTRQVFELQTAYTGIIGHITSLNPIRPANAADAWEEIALRSFEDGATEYYSQEAFDGAPYLRYMRPLIVEQRCLNCHAAQGYQLGQVRGGISESAPLTPLLAANRSFTYTIIIGHLGLWLIGLAGITFFGRRLFISLNRQAAAEEKLVQMSTYDTLTGLFNRGYFEETIRKLDTIKQKPISIISGDLDDLKKRNDRYGHAEGDRLLKLAADLLRRSFRDGDFVARTGGDEFIVLLPETTTEQAQAALARVRQVVETWNREYPADSLHISLGIATAERETSISEALKMADREMYADKTAYKRGQNAV